MPTQKDLKRRVRERMQKTGERYTTARTRLLDKRPSAEPPATITEKTSLPPAREFAKLAGMSDSSVAKATGRTWQQWVDELDRAGAAERSHREIALQVQREHRLTSWWAQTVTVGYERIVGRREPGQRSDGAFAVNKSKTYPVPLTRLWTGFVRCERWLDGAKLRMSKATKHKSMRMRWSDDTPVEVMFVAKGPAKSQVALTHTKLASRADADRLRTFWGERLAALGKVLAEQP